MTPLDEMQVQAKEGEALMDENGLAPSWGLREDPTGTLLGDRVQSVSRQDLRENDRAQAVICSRIVPPSEARLALFESSAEPRN